MHHEFTKFEKVSNPTRFFQSLIKLISRPGHEAILPEFFTQFRNFTKPLKLWATEILDGVEVICTTLDAGRKVPVYQQALDRQRASLEDFELLPSAQILAAMHDTGLPFARYAFALSESHERYFRDRRLDADKAAELRTLTAESIRSQEQVEANDNMEFEEFLRRYFNESLT